MVRISTQAHFTNSRSNFKNNLQTGIDQFDVNSTLYPFLSDSHLQNAFQRNTTTIQRMATPNSQVSVIDTAIVLSEYDTTRYVYSFNAKARKTSELIQMFKGDLWLDSLRGTYTYDANNNMLSSLHEYLGYRKGQWVNSERETYTYDANNNLLSHLSRIGRTTVNG